jgi:hypothetical protein
VFVGVPIRFLWASRPALRFSLPAPKEAFILVAVGAAPDRAALSLAAAAVLNLVIATKHKPGDRKLRDQDERPLCVKVRSWEMNMASDFLR